LVYFKKNKQSIIDQANNLKTIVNDNIKIINTIFESISSIVTAPSIHFKFIDNNNFYNIGIGNFLNSINSDIQSDYYDRMYQHLENLNCYFESIKNSIDDLEFDLLR
jgi:phage-related protein